LKGQAWQLNGIEISAPSAEKARARSGAQVFVGDIVEAPFPPESFDVITSFDVLEHLYHPRQTMEKVWEWLKPDGIFYVVIPNILSWEARIFRSYWYGLELPRHLSHFSPESLRNLLASVGFREESLETPPIHYLEYSTRYLCDDILRKVGFSRPPLSAGTNPGIPWRVVRKALRLTILALFGGTASLAGAGPSMEAIFRKGSRPNPAKEGSAS
jgi:SAM-dependent methyltransferase